MNTLNKRGCTKKSVEHLKHAISIPMAEGIPLTVEWLKKFYQK
jgi:hypothetical protein